MIRVRWRKTPPKPGVKIRVLGGLFEVVEIDFQHMRCKALDAEARKIDDLYVRAKARRDTETPADKLYRKIKDVFGFDPKDFGGLRL